MWRNEASFEDFAMRDDGCTIFWVGMLEMRALLSGTEGLSCLRGVRPPRPDHGPGTLGANGGVARGGG